jgi:hypothetical protein
MIHWLKIGFLGIWVTSSGRRAGPNPHYQPKSRAKPHAAGRLPFQITLAELVRIALTGSRYDCSPNKPEPDHQAATLVANTGTGKSLRCSTTDNCEQVSAANAKNGKPRSINPPDVLAVISQAMQVDFAACR